MNLFIYLLNILKFQDSKKSLIGLEPEIPFLYLLLVLTVNVLLFELSIIGSIKVILNIVHYT